MSNSKGMLLMKLTSCWKVAMDRSIQLAPCARELSPPHAIVELVVRCAIRNTPTGTIPVSECNRRKRKWCLCKGPAWSLTCVLRWGRVSWAQLDAECASLSLCVPIKWVFVYTSAQKSIRAYIFLDSQVRPTHLATHLLV